MTDVKTPDLPPAQTGRGRARDPWLDNARAILISLVIVGHLIETMGGRAADSLYTWIYAFHMPAFVLISGFLSKSYTGSTRQAKGLVATLLVPYVLFRAIHEAERWLVVGHFSTSLFVPSFALWFLLALFCWRIATPVLRVLRYPFMFAVVVFLLSPLDESLGTTFSLGRVFGFLPFFALGLVLRPEHLAVLKRRWVAVAGGVALAVGLAVAALVAPSVPRGALYLRGPYDDLHFGWLEGPAVRVLVLAAGLVGTVAVLAVTPRREGWWSAVGRNSLTVYLLQAAIIWPLKLRGDLEHYAGPAQVAVAVLVGFGLAAFLGTNTVERATRWLVRPPTGWLFVREVRL